MKIKNLLLLTILLSISSFASSQFTMMTIEAQKQGKFRGESTRSGHTEKIDVLGYMMQVSSPRDAASGQASGKRLYQPITIWKLSGAASPQFFQALTANENIKTVTIDFYRPDDVYKTTMVKAYTVVLTNASISSYKQILGTPDTDYYKTAASGLYDEIKFTFQKIQVTYTNGNVTASDDWQAPVSN